MYEQDKKVILTKSDVVQQSQRDLLLDLLKTIVGEAFFVGFCALITWFLVNNWQDHTWFVRISLILIAAFLWAVAVMVAIATVQHAIRLLCLHKGKYAIEIDRVGLLKLKTEEEYHASRSGRGGYTEIVTNQYVYFEKYGMVKSGRPLSNGQECYLLIVLTKKPHVIKFWECDIHEIQGV